MTAMRVSSTTLWHTSQQDLAGSLRRFADAQSQLSSGRRVARWSDDPVAAAQADAVRASATAQAGYTRSADDAADRLGAADTALQSMTHLLAKVSDLAIASRSGGQSAASRTALADQIDQLRSELVDLAGTRSGGAPVFGGTSGSAISGSAAPGGPPPTWTGDSAPVRRQVAEGVTVDVGVDGRKLFGFDDPGGDVFARLTALSDAVRSGDDAATTVGQQAVATSSAGTLSALSQVGSIGSRIEAIQNAGALRADALTAKHASLVDIDISTAVLQLQAAEQGYQAALSAAGHANLPSLADFLS